MSEQTQSAYGHTWPLNETPTARAFITVRVPHGSPDELRAELERRLDGLAGEVKIDVEMVMGLRLSPEDRAEHDRLEDEGYRRYLEGRAA